MKPNLLKYVLHFKGTDACKRGTTIYVNMQIMFEYKIH